MRARTILMWTAWGLAWVSGYLYGMASKRRIAVLVAVQHPQVPPPQ